MSVNLRPNSFLCGNNRPTALLVAATGSCLAIFSLGGFQQRAIANPIHLDGSTPLSALSTPPPNCGAVDCTITSSMTGDHYFHSFDAFNISPGVTVTFDAPSGVERIFSRLGRSDPNSGNEVRIEGTLAVSGSADLFFLSPDGIQILSTGRIVSGGSFIGTTAQSLVFADGIFETGTAAAPPPTLLTSSIPLGLNFLDGGKDIEVEGNNSTLLPFWQSQNGGTLALLGGNTGETFVEDRTVNVDQGGLVVAAVGPSFVAITAFPTSYTFDLAAATINTSGAVKLEEVSIVPTTSTSSGNINLYGESVSLDESTIRLETAQSAASSGNISISSSSLTLSDGSALVTKTTAPTGGSITINSGSIDLMDLDEDNDIIVEAPTNRLSLSQTPESTVNTDPSLFARGNGQNDVGYQSSPVVTLPVVTPPVVTPPVVIPATITPPAIPPVTPSVGAVTPPPSTPVIAPEPNTPEIEPVKEAAEPEADLSSSVSLWNSLRLNDEDEQQAALSVRSSDSSSAIASLCKASRTGALLTASNNGGIASSPHPLVGMNSLADLGNSELQSRVSIRSKFDSFRLRNIVSNSPVIAHDTASKSTIDVQTTKAMRDRFLHQELQLVEAIGWERSQTGQLKLVAQANTSQPPEFSVSCGAA